MEWALFLLHVILYAKEAIKGENTSSVYFRVEYYNAWKHAILPILRAFAVI